jgi:hypothetical protein
VRLNFPSSPSGVSIRGQSMLPGAMDVERLPERPPSPEELCDKTSKFTAPFLPPTSHPYFLISSQTLETSFNKAQSAARKSILASGFVARTSEMIFSATGQFLPVR